MPIPAHKLLMAGGSDGPPTLPVTTNLFAWYDASRSSSVHATSGRVDQWDDLSGNGWHLTSTGSNRPYTGSRTMNSLNVLDFQAGQFMQYASSPAFDVGTFSFLIVAGTDVTSGGQGFVAIHASSGNDYDTTNAWAFTSGDLSTFARIEINNGLCQYPGTGATPIGTWFGWKSTGFVGTEIMDPGANASTPVTMTAAGTANGGILVGSRFVSGVPTNNYLDGPIAELIIWDDTKDNTARSTMRTYAIAKWGA